MTVPFARETATRTIKGFHLALGAWLVASAFLLPHSAASFGNTWMMGLLTAVVAGVALLGPPGLVRVNAGFAAWLLASTFVVPYESTAAQLHNALAAIALLVASVVPARVLRRGEGPEPQRATA